MRSMDEIVADYVVDESKLKPYTLPDPLICEDGSRIGNAFDWMTRRRPEIMKIFMQEEWPGVKEKLKEAEELAEELRKQGKPKEKN